MLSLVRPSPLRLVLTVLFAALFAGTGALARAHLAPSRVVLPGVRAGGAGVPPAANEAELRAWVQRLARDREGRRASLAPSDAPGRILAGGSLHDFGVRVDVDATVARVLAVGRAHDVFERAARIAKARRGEIDVPLALSVDECAARARLEPLAAAEVAPPVSARLDIEHHDVLPEVSGRALDLDGAIAALTRAASTDPLVSAPLNVPVPVTSLAPRFTRDRIAGIDVHAPLGSYETYFSRAKDQAKRGTNIDVAAAKLDGLVLMPGELFSFNEAVGERSEENGFERSWEIHKGEMIEGVGGGTCQVASTLYAAAFFSGLDVIERLPHSRPSAYVPMGLDATVVYPDVDMKLRNPFSFPVAVHAKVDGNRIRIELLGERRPARSVEFKREIVEALPYERKVEEDDKLHGTTVRVKQHGIAGYTVKRTRKLSFAGGRTKVEETIDRYPPTMEIDEVPVGFDETLLASLPGAPDVAEPDDDTSASPLPGALAAMTAPPPSPGVVFIEAPGAHAPTKAQASPPRTLTLRR